MLVGGHGEACGLLFGFESGESLLFGHALNAPVVDFYSVIG